VGTFLLKITENKKKQFTTNKAKGNKVIVRRIRRSSFCLWMDVSVTQKPKNCGSEIDVTWQELPMPYGEPEKRLDFGEI